MARFRAKRGSLGLHGGHYEGVGRGRACAQKAGEKAQLGQSLPPSPCCPRPVTQPHGLPPAELAPHSPAAPTMRSAAARPGPRRSPRNHRLGARPCSPPCAGKNRARDAVSAAGSAQEPSPGPQDPLRGQPRSGVWPVHPIVTEPLILLLPPPPLLYERCSKLSGRGRNVLLGDLQDHLQTHKSRVTTTHMRRHSGVPAGWVLGGTVS